MDQASSHGGGVHTMGMDGTANVRATLNMPAGFVLHSLRHTYGTRLGEGGADAFSIMRLMRHSSVTVSQRYVHPTPEALEQAVERLEGLNAIALDALLRASDGSVQKLSEKPRTRKFPGISTVCPKPRAVSY